YRPLVPPAFGVEAVLLAKRLQPRQVRYRLTLAEQPAFALLPVLCHLLNADHTRGAMSQAGFQRRAGAPKRVEQHATGGQQVATAPIRDGEGQNGGVVHRPRAAVSGRNVQDVEGRGTAPGSCPFYAVGVPEFGWKG